MDREAFAQRVLSNWAERYELTLEVLQQPGIGLIPVSDFAGSGGIHAWYIANYTLIRFDPAQEAAVRALLAAIGDAPSLKPGQLAAAAPSTEIPVNRTERSLLSYLYPPDFTPAALPSGFTIRQLGSGDKQALAELQAACRAEEIDEAEVSVEDEIAFGCFCGRQLATVATGFTLTGFMDIGVITHPDFRKQGLGEAVVSTLSAWCLGREILPQYRCSDTNIPSHKLALRLGFATLVRSEHIYVELDT